MSKFIDNIKKRISQIWHAVTPTGLKCVACGRDINDKPEGLCAKCFPKLPVITGGFCLKCGSKVVGEGSYCESCGKNNHSFDEVRSVCEFDGLGRELVHRLKFSGQKYLAEHMAYMMSEVVKNQNWKIDCVAFVPMTKNASKKRGYNQARLLATELCDIISLPLFDSVEKVKETTAQATLNYADRMTNLKDAFQIIDKTAVKGKNILVTDDVKTTGATLDELARLFKKNGANEVYGLMFASRTQKTDLILENTKWDF